MATGHRHPSWTAETSLLSMLWSFASVLPIDLCRNARKFPSFCENWVCSYNNVVQYNELFVRSCREFSPEEICSRVMSKRNVAGNYRSGKYPGEKRLERNDRIPCRIASLDVQRLWFVISWLTDPTGTQVHIQTDNFWPVILLAQPA